MVGCAAIGSDQEKKLLSRSFPSSPRDRHHQLGVAIPRRVSNGHRHEGWNILDTAMNTLLRAALASSKCTPLSHARQARCAFSTSPLLLRAPVQNRHPPARRDARSPGNVCHPAPPPPSFHEAGGLLTLLLDQVTRWRLTPHWPRVQPCGKVKRQGQEELCTVSEPRTKPPEWGT